MDNKHDNDVMPDDFIPQTRAQTAFSPASDFSKPVDSDVKISSLVDAYFNTQVGRDRKTKLTAEQALLISVCRTYADSFMVIDRETGEMLEPPLMEMHELCDHLQDTAVSITGKGLDDIVKVLTARIQSTESDSQINSMMRRFSG